MTNKKSTTRCSDAHHPIVRIELLGHTAVWINGQRVDSRSTVLFACMLLFAFARGRAWQRLEIASLLWPNIDGVTRHARLRWLLAKMRKFGVPLEERDGVLRLAPMMMDIDADRVSELPPSEIGALLAGYDGTFSAAFERWLDEQQAILRAQIVRELIERAKMAASQADWRDAAAVAEAALRLDEADERATVILADALASVGERDRAMRVLDRYLVIVRDCPEQQVQARLMLKRLSMSADDVRTSGTALVGRDKQLAAIRALLDTARSGRGSALVLSGVPGIGKTRLLDEAVVQARLGRMHVLRLECQRGDGRRALAALAHLAQELRGMRGAAGCAPASIAEIDRFLQPLADDAPYPADDDALAGQRRQRLFSALRDLIASVAWDAPLLISFDDAQWMDPASGSVMRELDARIGTLPVALILTFRSGRGADKTWSHLRTLIVGPLDASAADALVDAVTSKSARQFDVETRRVLLERAAGNPLFLIELARNRDSARRAGVLPLSITNAFDAALESASPAAIRLLQVSAVLGSYATPSRVDLVAQMARPTFVDAVIELEVAGILNTESSGVLSAHALWSEAALARLSSQVARLLHRHAAERIDTEIAAHPSLPLLWESAYHWERAECAAQSLAALTRGAEHLARSGYSYEAAEAYERAIRQTMDPCETLSLRRRRVDLLRAAGHARAAIEEIDAHEQLARDVDPLYDTHNPLELHRARAVLDTTADSLQYLADVMRCARDPRAGSAHRLRAANQVMLVAELQASPVLHEAHAIARSIEPQDDDEQWARTLSELVYLRGVGNVDEYVACARRVVLQQRERSQATRLGPALEHAATSCLYSGRFADARAAFNEASALYRRHGLLMALMMARQKLLWMSVDVDPPSVTMRMLEDIRATVNLLDTRGNALFRTVFLPVVEAEIEVRHGDAARALSCVPAIDCVLALNIPPIALRVLAINLQGGLRVDRPAGLTKVATLMRPLLERAQAWHDWPAEVYASFLERANQIEEAERFARTYLAEWRRETFAPPVVLTRLADRWPPIGSKRRIPLSCVDTPRSECQDDSHLFSTEPTNARPRATELNA